MTRGFGDTAETDPLLGNLHFTRNYKIEPFLQSTCKDTVSEKYKINILSQSYFNGTQCAVVQMKSELINECHRIDYNKIDSNSPVLEFYAAQNIEKQITRKNV